MIEPAFVFGAALAVRLAFVAWGNIPRLPSQLTSDDQQYHSYAVHLLEEGRYVDDAGETARRMPGYPLFLAGVYSLFGHRALVPVYAVQSLLESLACVALYAAARKLYGGGWGLFGGLALAASWDLILPAGQILTEALASSLICAFLALWFLARERPALLAAGSALLWAAVCSMRPEYGLFALVLFLLMPRLSGGALRPAHAAWAFLLFSILLAPWPARNYLALHKFIPGCTDGDSALYGTLQEELTYLGDLPRSTPRDPGPGLSDIEQSRWYRDHAKAILRQIPLWKIARARAVGLLEIFYPFHAPVFYSWRYHYDATYMFFLPLWLYALWRWRGHRELDVVWLLLGTFCLFHLALAGDDARFRQPLTGALLLAATAAAKDALTLLGRKRFARWAAAYIGANVIVGLGAGPLRDMTLWTKKALFG